jgi:predicted transcriptional regulator
MVQLSIVILEEQKSKLMALAKQKMQSQASLVRQALQEFLKCQTSG